MKINRNELPGSFRGSLTRRFGTVLGVAMLASLAGCATTSPSRSAPASNGAATMVDQQMGQTIDSVDRSLKLLVRLDRGDEGARKDGFIGDTVAGAKAPNQAAPAMPNKAQPQTALGQQQEKDRLSYNRLALQARMKAQWDGSAADLLRQVAQAVDYRYQEVGSATLPEVHIKQGDASVQTVLEAAADQIRPAGSIKVLTGPRVICLVRSTSPEATCPASFAR